MAPNPRNGGPVRKVQAAPTATLPLGAPVDVAATADVAAGASSAGTATHSTTLAIGAELLCEPFENGAAVLGTVISIDDNGAELSLADLGTTWPVGLDRIDVNAGTWEHVASDYPVVGEEPLFDTARRPWLTVAAPPVAPSGAVDLRDAAAQFAKLSEAAARLAEPEALSAIVAPLVSVDGAAVNVPLASTAPRLAEPEVIAPIAPLNPAPVAAPGHPGPGWVLCRVTGLGTVSGDWIRQSDGRQLGVARSGDVGFFTVATVAKFKSIGLIGVLTPL